MLFARKLFSLAVDHLSRNSPVLEGGITISERSALLLAVLGAWVSALRGFEEGG
jgi:hypothetical protein